VRRGCKKVVKNRWFDRWLVVLILVSCVNLALDEPRVATCRDLPADDPSSCRSLGLYLRYSDYVITAFFALEGLLNLCGYGHAYLLDGWHLLDMGVVLVSIVTLFVGSEALKSFRSLRALRALRPLRLVSRFPRLRLVLNAVFVSLPRVKDVVILDFLVAYVFGVVGLQNFLGVMFYCNNGDPAATAATCVGSFNATNDLCALQPTAGAEEACRLAGNVGLPVPAVWAARPENFDSIGAALTTVFELTTGENWPTFMFYGVDGVGDQQPAMQNADGIASVYYCLIQLVLNMFLVELFASIVVETYNALRDRAAGSGLLSPSQRIWVQNVRVLFTLQLPPLTKPPRSRFRRWQAFRLSMFAFARSRWYTAAATCVMLLNVGAAASLFYGQSEAWTRMQFSLSAATGGLYVLEVLIPLIAFGGRQYFGGWWTRLDAVAIAAAWASIFVPSGLAGAILRICRATRVMRLVQFSPPLQRLLRTLILCVPAFLNILTILALDFFVFTVIAMNVFAGVRQGASGVLSADANFDSFGIGLITLIRAATGENFNLMMWDLTVVPPYCVPTGPGANCGVSPSVSTTFWVAFYTITTFILLNMVTAVLLEAHQEASEKRTAVDGTYRLNHDVAELYARLWAVHDPRRTLLLPVMRLIAIVAELPAPLGVAGSPALAAKQRAAVVASASRDTLTHAPQSRLRGLLPGLGLPIPHSGLAAAAALAGASAAEALRAGGASSQEEEEPAQDKGGLATANPMRSMTKGARPAAAAGGAAGGGERAAGRASAPAPAAAVAAERSQRASALRKRKARDVAALVVAIEAEKLVCSLPLVPDASGQLQFHAVLQALVDRASTAPPLGERTNAINVNLSAGAGMGGGGGAASSRGFGMQRGNIGEEGGAPVALPLYTDAAARRVVTAWRRYARKKNLAARKPGATPAFAAGATDAVTAGTAAAAGVARPSSGFASTSGAATMLGAVAALAKQQGLAHTEAPNSAHLAAAGGADCAAAAEPVAAAAEPVAAAALTAADRQAGAPLTLTQPPAPSSLDSDLAAAVARANRLPSAGQLPPPPTVRRHAGSTGSAGSAGIVAEHVPVGGTAAGGSPGWAAAGVPASPYLAGVPSPQIRAVPVAPAPFLPPPPAAAGSASSSAASSPASSAPASPLPPSSHAHASGAAAAGPGTAGAPPPLPRLSLLSALPASVSAARNVALHSPDPLLRVAAPPAAPTSLAPHSPLRGQAPPRG